VQVLHVAKEAGVLLLGTSSLNRVKGKTARYTRLLG